MLPTGNLYVISAPSGTGKTTLVNTLVKSMKNVTVSISHTTRPKRDAEIHGVNYYFVSHSEFEQMIAHQDFLEHATVFNHFYGTSRSWVEKTLSQGIDVILEIDWQGCQQIQRLFPDCISIFILPPSLMDLFNRLNTRDQDAPDIIRERLDDAQETVKHYREFDYMVVNADFEHAVKDLKIIIQTGRLMQKQQSIRYAELLRELIK